MKKVISMMMALALTFALAIPAFAANPTSYSFNASSVSEGGHYSINSAGHNFTMEPDIQVPTVNVFVPASNQSTDKLVLNPYGLKYTLGTQTDLQDQVISSPIFLGSLSNTPLIVGMTVKATHPANVVLASKSLAEDTRTTTNSVFIWGQVADAGEGEARSESSLSSVTFSEAYDDTEGKEGSMILVKSGDAGSTRTGLYTIPAVETSAVTAGNTAKTQWACVKFFGDAVKAPTTPWASADKVKLAITFTFTPAMEDAG